jgi:hypothetical protein
MKRRGQVLLASVAILAVPGCGKDRSAPPMLPTPTANRPPTITAVSVSPQGMGIVSATIFTFGAQGVADPDGDTLTYTWSSTDGSPIASTTQATSHVYARAGGFDMRVTVTDPKGLTASAATTVIIGNVAGTWDVSCLNRNPQFPTFPSQFVVSMTQFTTNLIGTISAAGLTRNLNSQGSVVRDPKQVTFGVESSENVWASRDSDLYFRLNADDTLSTMTGSTVLFFCGSSVARRR